MARKRDQFSEKPGWKQPRLLEGGGIHFQKGVGKLEPKGDSREKQKKRL